MAGCKSLDSRGGQGNPYAECTFVSVNPGARAVGLVGHGTAREELRDIPRRDRRLRVTQVTE
jgi:hypothetical protein